MAIFNITGDDTLTLFGRVFNDFADADNSTLDFPNDLVNLKTGKNSNTIFAKNETGNNGELVLRLMRGSSDDQFMQARFAEMERDFASFVLAQGQFVKRHGDGQGNPSLDIYTMLGGIFTKKIAAKTNAEGDTDQAVAVYTMRFAQVKRGN